MATQPAVPQAADSMTPAVVAKAQPWKSFMAEPEVRPFPADEKAAKTSIRLKSEKDEHGLGG